MKLKLFELRAILDALKELDKYDIQAVYELAKNIKICSAIVDAGSQLESDILSRYVDKDPEGKPVVYKEGTSDIIKITDAAKLELYRQDAIRINSEEYDIEFVKIPSSRLEKVKGLSAMTLLPLLDTVIKDEK